MAEKANQEGNEDVKITTVTLKVKGGDRKKDFPIDQANALLSLRNAAWELDDAKAKWNGTEIAKK